MVQVGTAAMCHAEMLFYTLCGIKKLLPIIDGWNESLYIELSSVVELATRAKILSYHTILNVYP
jgi:hypothetical protein